MSDLIISFDSAMDLAKQEKYDQMNIRVSKMRSSVMKQKQKLQKSLIDSTMDTIQIQLHLSVMEKEYAVANGLFTALFPAEIAAAAATFAATITADSAE